MLVKVIQWNGIASVLYSIIIHNKTTNSMFSGSEMKKMYCIKCGHTVNVKFGIFPNRCTCGAEFNEWDKHTVKNIRIIYCFFITPNVADVYHYLFCPAISARFHML